MQMCCPTRWARLCSGHSPSETWAGIFLTLLREVVALVGARGGRLVNVDGTVLAQAPRLVQYLPEMARRLAETLVLPIDAVSVKAKSPEGLGLLGRREGIAAMAVVGVEIADVNTSGRAESA
jgi:2-C-methyl-D-erythritol 2,4-cyclodiphosphate synthase